MFTVSVTISEIFSIEICTWPLECAKVKCKYANRKRVCEFLFVDTGNVCSIRSPFARYSQSKMIWPWPWTLEWAKVKCKYVIRTPLCDFISVGNSNVCSICNHLRHIHSRNVHNVDLHNLSRLKVNMWIERPHPTLYVLEIVMFILSATYIPNRSVHDFNF